ncbi:hypothetical protein [Ferrovibrio terrae]|uniref:hypothetical protein n=1 Tax=Ferrovibrio terrae TaxID=2594003 RepID=UPI0031380886
MLVISHRRNTIDQLRETPIEFGVEVDIRSHGADLIIHHDPFTPGLRFNDWLEHYRHRFVILNVKEEGLEQALLDCMKRCGIEDFFFLDQSFPFLIRTVRSGESRVAIRYSEFESIETAMSLAGKIDWVWVDCFTHLPLDAVAAAKFRAARIKTCIVSPELHGRDGLVEIPAMRAMLKASGVVPDAVCTKMPGLWA